MKQIGLAFHSYHDKYGQFPPAYIADENGKPMHSWRVLILPFIDQEALYNRYNFAEPWDGPNNRKLLDERPSFFACPSYVHQREHNQESIDEQSTNYVLITGDGTLYPTNEGPSLGSMERGAENSLLLTEVGHRAVPWLAPEDIAAEDFIAMFGGEETHEELGIGHASVIVTCFADARPKEISLDIDTESLRKIVYENFDEEAAAENSNEQENNEAAAQPSQ